MGRAAAPSSSRSSPQLGSKRALLSSQVDWKYISKTRRHCISMVDVMRRTDTVDASLPVTRARRDYTYYETVVCETCGSGDRADDLLLCDRCDCGHHTFCLGFATQVPIGPWFCPVCNPPRKAPKDFPLDETEIYNFFGIQKDEQDADQAEAAKRMFSKALPANTSL